jgi:50S ribosomal subunit-associated GTPase HflX
VAKVRETVALNNRRSHKFHLERFNLKKLNEVEGKEKYRFEVSNKFAALEDLYAEVEINSAWETIRENIKISAREGLSYIELKKHRPRFDERCRKLLEQRQHTKLQWLQDPGEINGNNLNNVRHEVSRYFRNKNKEYLATDSKNKNIRDLYSGINELKRAYQPRNKLMKHKNGNLLADCAHALSIQKI